MSSTAASALSYTVETTRRDAQSASAFVAKQDGTRYGVTVGPNFACCSCPDAMYRGRECKHVAMVRTEFKATYRPISVGSPVDGYSFVLRIAPGEEPRNVATFTGPAAGRLPWRQRRRRPGPWRPPRKPRRPNCATTSPASSTRAGRPATTGPRAKTSKRPRPSWPTCFNPLSSGMGCGRPPDPPLFSGRSIFGPAPFPLSRSRSQRRNLSHVQAVRPAQAGP